MQKLQFYACQTIIFAIFLQIQLSSCLHIGDKLIQCFNSCNTHSHSCQGYGGNWNGSLLCRTLFLSYISRSLGNLCNGKIRAVPCSNDALIECNFLGSFQLLSYIIKKSGIAEMQNDFTLITTVGFTVDGFIRLEGRIPKQLCI